MLLTKKEYRSRLHIGQRRRSCPPPLTLRGRGRVSVAQPPQLPQVRKVVLVHLPSALQDRERAQVWVHALSLPVRVVERPQEVDGLLPLHAEQLLLAKNLARCGAGIMVSPDQRQPDFKKLLSKLVTTAELRGGAADLAGKYAQFDAQKNPEIIAQKLMSLA